MCVVAIQVGAWEPLPSPEVADTEVSRDISMGSWNTKQKVSIELTFNATPTNNVEVTFGVDTNGDKELDITETRMILGWECGRWFLQDAPVCENYFVESFTGERKTLSYTMLVNEEGTPTSIRISDGDTPIFTGITKPRPPQWLHVQDWNRMRLTARGVDAQHEHFFFEATADGFMIFFR